MELLFGGAFASGNIPTNEGAEAGAPDEGLHFISETPVGIGFGFAGLSAIAFGLQPLVYVHIWRGLTEIKIRQSFDAPAMFV